MIIRQRNPFFAVTDLINQSESISRSLGLSSFHFRNNLPLEGWKAPQAEPDSSPNILSLSSPPASIVASPDLFFVLDSYSGLRLEEMTFLMPKNRRGTLVETTG